MGVPPVWVPPPPPQYQEGLVGTLADGGIVGAVDGRLAGEAGVKLADVFLRLLRGWGGGGRQVVGAPMGAPNAHPAHPTCPVVVPPPPPPCHTRQGLKGGSSRRASRSSQLMWRKKGCFCGQRDGGGHQAGIWGGGHPPGTHPPACTCTSAASPGPPPTLWLGFLLRNWKRKKGGWRGAKRGGGGGW